MAGTMRTFDSARRDLLRLSSMGLAASAVSAIPALGAAKKAAAPPLSPMLFDVRTFGATGDGKTVDSPAINKAIEAAAAAGGGTVIFPAGNYLSFSIRLKSHVDLYLSQGCDDHCGGFALSGQTTGYMGGTYDAAEPQDPAIEPFQDYGHNHWHNSLLWGDGISDFSVTGPGLIWGRGLSAGVGGGRPPAGRGCRRHWDSASTAPVAGAAPSTAPQPPRRRRQKRPCLRAGHAATTPLPAEQAGVGNKAFGLKNCRNVVLRDFSILKGGHFAILVTGVDNLTIDNLKIDTDRDGMDIDCCKNVRVSNCTVNSPWDDAIVPKSSYALGYARACNNIAITNCYVTGCWELGTVLDGTWKRRTGGGGTGRIKFGTESNGGFINIAISNCVFEGCQGLAMETVDGALLEDITVSNITMRDIISCPIFLRLGARLRGPKSTAPGGPNTVVGSLKRVLINNINCFNTVSRYGSNITGIPGYPVKDLKISDVYIQCAGGGTPDQVKIDVPENIDRYPEPGMLGTLPTYGFYFRHLNRLEMSHVEIAPVAPDPRPAIYLDDVHRADFFAITAPSSPAAFSINKSTDVRILMSRAAPDSTTP